MESTRVGVAKYLAPLIFVYNPSLLFVGPLWLTVVSTLLALAGLWVLSSAVEGWCNGPLSGAKRAVLLIAAILLLFPPTAMIADGVSGWFAPVAGAIIAAVLLAPSMKRKTTEAAL